MRGTQTAGPGVSTPLHDRFAAGVRVLLRRKIPATELELGVFYVLVTIARELREGRIQDDENLARAVRAKTAAFIDEVSAPRTNGAVREIERMRRVLRQLNPTTREILTRLYHLEQTPAEIGRHMNVSLETIQSVKKNARDLLSDLKSAAK